jgi:polyisoprenoid-binding protein YceI
MNLIFLLLMACGEVATDKSDSLDSVDDIPTPSAEVDPENVIEEDVTANYIFDDEDSLLYVQVYKNLDAAASGMAHDHVMRATNWDGLVTYNPEDITKCSIGFALPVQDLQVDEDAMREYVGYGDTITTGDRETIRDHMLAEDQLNGAIYTDIIFTSTSCQISSEDRLIVTGDMTIRDVTREWDIDINFSAQENSFYMSGVIDFTHSDFNIVPYSAFFGAVSNSEPLKITFDMVGDRADIENDQEVQEEGYEEGYEEVQEDFAFAGPYDVAFLDSYASVTNCNMNYFTYSPVGVQNPPVVVLGHGFARGAETMIGWAEHLSSWGVEVLLPTLCHYNVFWGVDHELNGQNMVELGQYHGSEEVVYVGHSAGGLAAIIAASLDNNALGVLGLDTTDTEGVFGVADFIGQAYAPNITSTAFSIRGEPDSCNSNGNGMDLFEMIEGAYKIKVNEADHCDFEFPTNSGCEFSCENSNAARPDSEIRSEIIILGTSAILSLADISESGWVLWSGSN